MRVSDIILQNLFLYLTQQYVSAASFAENEKKKKINRHLLPSTSLIKFMTLSHTFVLGMVMESYNTRTSHSIAKRTEGIAQIQII